MRGAARVLCAILLVWGMAGPMPGQESRCGNASSTGRLPARGLDDEFEVPTLAEPSAATGDEAGSGADLVAVRVAEPVFLQARPRPRFLRTYMNFKIGPFWPKGDLARLDSGLYSGFGIGHYLNPYLALEATFDYFTSSGNSGAFWADVWGMPFLATVRGMIPLEKAELFGSVGLGAAYVDARGGRYSTSLFNDSDWVGAAAFSLGASYRPTPEFFVGLEAKYFITGEADIDAEKLSFSGFAGTLTVGFRF